MNKKIETICDCSCDESDKNAAANIMIKVDVIIKMCFGVMQMNQIIASDIFVDQLQFQRVCCWLVTLITISLIIDKHMLY